MSAAACRRFVLAGPVVAALLAGCGGATGSDATAGASVVSPAPVTSQATAVSGHVEACHAVTDAEVAALFDRWNEDVQSGEPAKVVENYAPQSVLLPTVSNQVRVTAAEKEDYFQHFLADKPTGRIDARTVILGCNSAVDAGTYTFTYGKTGKVVPARYSFTYAWDGTQWLITSHHSSGMPEPVGSAKPSATR